MFLKERLQHFGPLPGMDGHSIDEGFTADGTAGRALVLGDFDLTSTAHDGNYGCGGDGSFAISASIF